MRVPQVVKIVLQEAVEVPLNILAGIVENGAVENGAKPNI